MPRASRARTVARTPFSSWTRGLPRPAEGVGLNNMDPNEPDGTAGARDKPLGRGLEDVSHLFLSRKTADASASDRATARSPEPSSAPPGSRGGVALLRPAPITRGWLVSALLGVPAGFEEGGQTVVVGFPVALWSAMALFDA